MNLAVTEYYKTNLTNCNEQISRYEVLINRYSILRLLTLGTGIFLFYQSLKFDGSWLPVLVFFAVVLAFASLVRKQNLFEKKRNYFRDLAKVYTNELNSIKNRDNIYPDGSLWTDDAHPYSSDLDIFGRRSLFEMLNRCATVSGNVKLADWLKMRAPVKTIEERQAAIRELASKQNWKHNFQAVLLFSNQPGEAHAEKLFKYMALASDARTGFLRIYLKWIPGLFLTSAILSWYYPVFLLVILGIGIANLLLMQSYSVLILKMDSLIGKMSIILERFSEAISGIGSEKWESTLCAELASGLKEDQQDKLPQQIRKLSMLINRLSLGLSSVGIVLNFVMAWNVRQFFAVEEWKRNNKVNLAAAFDVIASFEALISLSSLRNNYPGWAFPGIIEKNSLTLTAKAIAHPLIRSDLRIENDYSLDNELRIDIITGSNMAGKSTFLRTLGINIVLALSGAPVCAREMSLSPMLVFSYMRIKDSLNESTSTFKAELDRLQHLLEILRTEDKVYFLIDEMLRGTNSVDKYLGSKAVIEKLIDQKAVGIIATHDLQIAELEQKYPDYIRNFYFDIQIEGSEMRFDYKLKEGECKTFNASLLLRGLGIYPE
ncbi:MAG: MutS-related protein [Daejeonella sp.]